MMRIVLLMAVAIALWSTPIWADGPNKLRQSNGTYTDQGGVTDSAKVTLGTALAGADATIDVMKVEQRFSFVAITGDTSVKASAGFLHAITCQSDAAATAGSIIAYNNTAESGTQIWNWVVSAVEYQPQTLIFDVSFSTGLFIGYTTTADVNCTVSFR